MSHTAVTATMSSLCIALVLALMAAGCVLAGLSPTTEEQPCKPPSA